MSTLFIVITGLVLMFIFEGIKLLLQKFLPNFNEKFKAYYGWMIWGITFLVIYLTGIIKSGHWIPLSALVDSGLITSITVWGYELLKPIAKKLISLLQK